MCVCVFHLWAFPSYGVQSILQMESNSENRRRSGSRMFVVYGLYMHNALSSGININHQLILKTKGGSEI